MNNFFLVSTPIGNLEDITLRAIRILKEVDIIAAEDTRVARKLLNHYSISGKRIIVYNDHNKKSSSMKIVKFLEENRSVALITDAGTPCISDPGYYIVNCVLNEGGNVISIPGPSSLTASLSVSGMPTDAFTFYGFLPRKKGARKKKLTLCMEKKETAVFFESPFRIDATLEMIASIDNERKIAVCREMTKIYEECLRGNATEILSNKWKRKGEIVLLIRGV